MKWLILIDKPKIKKKKKHEVVDSQIRLAKEKNHEVVDTYRLTQEIPGPPKELLFITDVQLDSFIQAFQKSIPFGI